MNEPGDLNRLLHEVRQFLDLLESADAAELEWEGKEFGLRITRRRGRARRAVPSENGGVRQPERLLLLTSPVVGIFHFFEDKLVPGMAVGLGQSLGYVEAVNVKHPVEAEGAGRLSEIHVKEGQPVEYGQPLFTLEEHVP